MTIKEAQQQTDQWVREIGGGYFGELTNLGILIEEVGELARWLVRTHGDQNMKPAEKEMNASQEIRDEVADIFWQLVCLANQLEIDLTEAFKENLHKKTTRDHARHINKG